MTSNEEGMSSRGSPSIWFRAMRSAAILLTAMSVGTTAIAAECVPVDKKELSGDFVIPGGGGWVSDTIFERGGCDWNGLDALNGFDARVFEVEDHQGLPATLTPGGSGEGVTAWFLNEDCERSGFTPVATTDEPATVVIPEKAKWVVAIAASGRTASSVTIKIAPRKCKGAPVNKKKKKKKKRTR